MRITIDIRAERMDCFVVNNLANIINKCEPTGHCLLVKEFDNKFGKYQIYVKKTPKGYSIKAI